MWKLPDDPAVVPKFTGDHEKKRLRELHKQQKKLRRAGGTSGSAAAPVAAAKSPATGKPLQQQREGMRGGEAAGVVTSKKDENSSSDEKKTTNGHGTATGSSNHGVATNKNAEVVTDDDSGGGDNDPTVPAVVEATAKQKPPPPPPPGFAAPSSPSAIPIQQLRKSMESQTPRPTAVAAAPAALPPPRYFVVPAAADAPALMGDDGVTPNISLGQQVVATFLQCLNDTTPPPPSSPPQHRLPHSPVIRDWLSYFAATSSPASSPSPPSSCLMMGTAKVQCSTLQDRIQQWESLSAFSAIQQQCHQPQGLNNHSNSLPTVLWECQNWNEQEIASSDPKTRLVTITGQTLQKTREVFAFNLSLVLVATPPTPATANIDNQCCRQICYQIHHDTLSLFSINSTNCATNGDSSNHARTNGQYRHNHQVNGTNTHHPHHNT